ncbi:MAG: ABC transporter substrate-binding protein [Anaerolineae bacterium]|nr:ABC transporter substrate-binding protein [Anaerolineae bacterium]MCB9459002.1 ABC transporter substrate-binding protein [Anaerolineaceae bacterium]
MSTIRRGLTLALVLAVLSLTVGVMAQDVAREDTVIFDIDSSQIANPTNFNWLVPGTLRNHGAHQAMWEPLFILNYETGLIEPWLGTSFDANESLDVWTLNLREGVKWSDGEAFNADDVMFTINMLLGDETATLAEAANMQQWVDSVEKIDDLTVQFNLKEPNPRFQLDYFSVRIWGSVLIMPEHVWAGKDPFTFTFYDEEQGWPIGTGPYTLTSAETDRMVWDRDDNWWGAETGFMDLPEPLRLIWIITSTEENRAQLMSNAQLDSVMNITLGAFEAIQARNPNVVAWFDELPYAWADPCARQMSFNTQVAPWDNVNMRKAVSLIIDRQQIIDVAYEGTTTPSRSFFVQYGGMEPIISAIEEAGMTLSPTADVAAAQAMIEAEGYTMNDSGLYEKDGEVLTADIVVNNSSIEYTRTVDVIVEQLIAAGIDAVARPVTGATHGDLVNNGEFQLSYDWDGCGSINEPWNSMNRYTAQFLVPIGERSPGSNNWVRWDTEGNAAYSEIVGEIGVLPLGDPAIVDMVVEAYQYLYDEVPIVPLVQASKLVPFDTTYWTGWPTQENNYNHPATWWNSTHQIIHNLTKAG